MNSVPARAIKTKVKDLTLGDWGPAMRGIAWALGHAVAIPVAVLIVLAQWLAFTWRKPLTGVLALVPVRRPNPIDATNQGMAALNLTTSSPNLATTMAAIAADAKVVGTNIRAALQGLDRPAPLPLVPAPAPRRQRRRSNRPQSTA